MKQLTNDQKITYVLKVIHSCENLEQLANCVNWIDKMKFSGDSIDVWRIEELLYNEYADVRIKLTGGDNLDS